MAGVPLKDWDIKIFRGILTGYNEAFIITGSMKDELIASDPKSAEIIRPTRRCAKVWNQYTACFRSALSASRDSMNKHSPCRPFCG